MSTIQDRAAFDLIRYGQCWEDADVLLAALRVKKGDTCLSIASAGDNTLALLTGNPKRVMAVDLSRPQLHCLRARIAAYECLSHSEFLELYGSLDSRRRTKLMERCLPRMDATCAEFWIDKLPLVEQFGLGGSGKFEHYFRLFAERIVPLIHSRTTVAELLREKPADMRRAFFDRHWNTWLWRLMIKAFFNRTVMGWAGRDPAFFDYVDGDVAAHVLRRIDHAFAELNPAENPYLQWILCGRHVRALPVALRAEHYATIRSRLDRVELFEQPMELVAARADGVDAFNLSDIFEYMTEDAYRALHGKLVAASNTGARLAYWNMMVPRGTTTPKGVVRDDDLSTTLYKADKAFFYSNFHVETVK